MKRPRGDKDEPRNDPPRDDRGLTREDRRIWRRVASSVTPAAPRKPPRIGPDAAPAALMTGGTDTPRPTPARPSKPPATLSVPPGRPVKPAPPRVRSAPEDVEPNRKRRLSRERDPIEARIDLHGFGRFEAEDQLRAFLTACQARGLRAVLVITGQGRLGGGVIRAAFAEWMQAPALRAVVSGFTVAHARHGGNGAFYVTLRRKG